MHLWRHLICSKEKIPLWSLPINAVCKNGIHHFQFPLINYYKSFIHTFNFYATGKCSWITLATEPLLYFLYFFWIIILNPVFQSPKIFIPIWRSTIFKLQKLLAGNIFKVFIVINANINNILIFFIYILLHKRL